jgi:flagellar assembly protein FliH
MMNSSSSTEYENVFSLPVKTLEYFDMADPSASDGPANLLSDAGPRDTRTRRRPEVELTQEEFAERILRERADATQLTEARLRQDYESKLQAARAPIVAAVNGFAAEREQYFSRVEKEVVQLALSIAAKILHREAQVDPTLVAALVRMTIEKMREGSSVTVRVGPGRAKLWKEYFASQSATAHIDVAEDAGLSSYDCILETELGVTNFGLDTQLKEIEKGFFDLMALRPDR